MHAIILAGGFATRLWPLTEKTPKPLVIVGGRPLLSHIVDKVPDDVKIILSVNSFFAHDFKKWREEYLSQLRKTLTQRERQSNKQIDIFVEDAENEGEKLGALFAVAKCIQDMKIKDDLMILAGDNFFDFKVEDFIEDFKNDPMIAVYDIKEKEEAKKFGVVVPKDLDSDENLVDSFEEKPSNPKSTLVSTGCSIIPARLLDDLCKFAETNRDDLGKIFEHFLENKNNVNYFKFEGKWFDIGGFKAFLEAHKAICGEKVIKAKNAKDTDVDFTGSVFIGEDVVLENCIVEDSVILSGANVKNAEVRNSVIGKNATLIGVDLDWKILRDESFVSVE